MRWVSGLFGGRFCDCSVGANGKREGKGVVGVKTGGVSRHKERLGGCVLGGVRYLWRVRNSVSARLRCWRFWKVGT